MTKRGIESKATAVGQERQVSIPFRGVRMPIYDKATREAHELKMPLSVELFWPTGKYTPSGTPGSKCLRGKHRPPNKKTGLCTRCGTNPLVSFSPTASGFDSESFDATHRTRGFRS